MKQFIVLAATLPLMLAILVQFSLEQLNMHRLIALESTVDAFRLYSSRGEGIDDAGVEKLRRRAADIYRVDLSSVGFEAAESEIEGVTEFTISVPSKRLLTAYFEGDEDPESAYIRLRGTVVTPIDDEEADPESAEDPEAG
ncbi:MAG: hypothetical protein LBK04_04060 [Clostridiales Family XIII bacterium]|jgi:hypothetical protein|nr:hypothetical protein [Clostridiales Family XIII bacterium]